MIVNKGKNKYGHHVLNDFAPFEAENGLEEFLYYYLHNISNNLEDLLAATQGEIDNAVEIKLFRVDDKLDAILQELKHLREVSRLINGNYFSRSTTIKIPIS